MIDIEKIGNKTVLITAIILSSIGLLAVPFIYALLKRHKKEMKEEENGSD